MFSLPLALVLPLRAAPLELAYDAKLALDLAADGRLHGDAQRGAAVIGMPAAACMSCHKIGRQGGEIGPDLSEVGKRLSPQEIVESVLWPNRVVKPEYIPILVTTTGGEDIQGYRESESDAELVLREPGTATTHRIKKNAIQQRRKLNTLMPDGLVAAMSPEQRRDLFRFLIDLGQIEGTASMLEHAHEPAKFDYVRNPLRPEDWPHWQTPVNRDRLYDFYAKEAEYFMKLQPLPMLLPEHPGLDGGKFGHWGNQNEQTWADERWNQTELGTVMCGVFRFGGVTVNKGVCARLGENGELSTCFNPETLCYEAVWQGGFVKFGRSRHGFMDGLILNGNALPRPAGKTPAQPFVYHGFYRQGKRVVFSYKLGEVEMLDAPWVENGQFTRTVAPAKDHPMASLTRGGPAQWPQVLETRGTRGQGRPYAVDTIEPPFQNPWNALLFFGGHDFLPDGTGFVCTMQGDVWRVEGLDDKLEHVRWRRIASGLHQALGLVVADNSVYVLGRDQITRLMDLNGDGETDFYECVASGFITSSSAHDFICGLERDAAGNFYTASGNQGVLRLPSNGRGAEVLATGFRNPDGIALTPSGNLTVPCSEGEWTPASMICEIKPPANGSHPQFFGYGGPRNNQPPALPLAYLPRGIDNSSGGQVFINSERWGPLSGKTVHLSYGAGSHFLLLRDEVAGQAQGAIVPLAGEFLSGAHRGRFNPKDGQLYVSGMGGWGTYTPADGCFQRVRYTGDPVQLPIAFHVHQNGLLLQFTQPIDRNVAQKTANQFAQCWNYRYSAAYGSPEFSPRHRTVPGHDPLAITSAHVLIDDRSLFLEMPDLQPVNQVHLHLRVNNSAPQDIFLTVHQMDSPFKDFPGYQPAQKVIAAHPVLTDLAQMKKPKPNPWRNPISNARLITIKAGPNLSFEPRSFTVSAGEPISITFLNPDVVPHNWALTNPGALERVGDLANRIIADPEAVLRHYVPATEDVIAFTDITFPEKSFTIYLTAPTEKGRYPYLCTFPGHWMLMNGVMVVE